MLRGQSAVCEAVARSALSAQSSLSHSHRTRTLTEVWWLSMCALVLGAPRTCVRACVQCMCIYVYTVTICRCVDDMVEVLRGMCHV